MKHTPCPTCLQALPVATQTIDMDARIIVANGYFASLSEHEFAIFMTLYAASGKMKTREQLLRAISSFIDEEPDIKIIDVYIFKIRNKTKNLGFQIQSVWGEGYRLIQKGHTHE